jgi:hypothetical protein
VRTYSEQLESDRFRCRCLANPASRPLKAVPNAPPPSATFNPVYDNNGSMTLFQSVPGRGARAGLRSTVDAEYDAYNRPYYMEVTETGGLNEDYRYGPTGLLFQFMQALSFITEGRRYVYDGGRIVAEYVFTEDALVTVLNPPMRLDRTHVHGVLGETGQTTDDRTCAGGDGNIMKRAKIE